MLTPEQIAALRDAAGQIADPINDYLIADIARRISEAGQLTSTAAYEVWRAQQLGIGQREIKKRLRELLKVSHRDLRKLLTQSAEVGYNFDIKNLPQVQAVSFKQNQTMQQIVSAAVELAQDDFTNLTQTMGLIDPYGKALPLQDAYRSCMDYAFKQVSTGASDYNSAIRRACKNLADKGVQWIDYESGVHTSLEAAVRRNIMGGLGLMQEQITQQNHDDMGADGWEISAHANSAPDHEPIQGKQYTDAAYTALNDSLVRRIGTLNCGHAAFPIILGVSAPQYTDEELKKFREDNATGVTYQGRHYTGYEATQMQRKVERAIKTQKRRILVDESTGNKDKLTTDQIRLRRLDEEYKRFSKAAGLRTEIERAQVTSFGPRQAARARAATNQEFIELLANAVSGDKIVLSEDMEGIISWKSFSEIQPLQRKLSNRAARKWYLAQDAMIPSQIDQTQSLELQAQQACELRNLNRTHARDLMREQEERRRLDVSDPNRTFEELLGHKMIDKGMTREAAIADILKTATKTRSSVNKELGLE